MLGALYDRALDGEGRDCWVRHDNGEQRILPVWQWLGGRGADEEFDAAVVGMCAGPTIELGCGPGRLVAMLVERGVPAVGIDQSLTAVSMARRRGAPAVCGDVFAPLPAAGCWQTVLLADGTIGLGGDPVRLLVRVADLLAPGGWCVAEVEPTASGVRSGWVRLESGDAVGPWFRWAWMGIDAAAVVAEQAGLALTAVEAIGQRVVVRLTKP
ncbi:class I SAM-dependent methyltransferase [Mycobacterium simiae]|uniref:methyltransferase domain-containing protein n=1 Tax=Mycobacterium simiae TaxID=1784 RepID=UPI00260483E8|nr:class I SAM-dependent methyltransferase [Mycobacterium simiae]